MQMDDDGSRGQRVKLAIAVAVLIGAGVWAWIQLGGDSAYQKAAIRNYYCVETQQPFDYKVKRGDRDPVLSPHSGQHTGYQAELCFWTKDESGNWKAKTDPTYVVLKRKVDPNNTEKDYCPDCGREVVGHNPRPPEELMAAARAESGE